MRLHDCLQPFSGNLRIQSNASLSFDKEAVVMSRVVELQDPSDGI